MPTECERNSTSLAAQKATTTAITTINPATSSASEQQQQQLELEMEAYQRTFDMSDNVESGAAENAGSHMISKSQTSTTSSIESPTTEYSTTTPNGLKGSTNGGDSKKTSLVSPDPTSYVTKARVTRPIPPPPSCNPLQFVQIKPCNLYQTAQEQLKKAEEVKKIKEIKKEEPEDWQNNLDNWKSSRRKRVEHIIDRVVEVKKLELEEHDRSRRKSKTFSEMIEERGERAGGRGRTSKLTSLAVYNEDESNDLSDLGIGTSSASGKSSLSEDYDNNSVTSDNAELDKAIQSEQNYKSNIQKVREYISSPGYETSSSTAPASSPDPCEYTYEGAIQDYKQRISRATNSGSSGCFNKINGNGHGNNNHHITNGNDEPTAHSNKQAPTTLNLQTTNKPSDPTANTEQQYTARRGHKIEDRLLSFEITSPSAEDSQIGADKPKVDVPKVDITKRKEIFENQKQQNATNTNGNGVAEHVPRVNLRERFKFDAPTAEQPQQQKEVKRLSGDLTSIRQRLQSLEQQKDEKKVALAAAATTSRSIDMPSVPPLKERLSSLQNAVNKEEIKKPPVALVDARQLEIMRKEEETAKQRMQENKIVDKNIIVTPAPPAELDDSGILTTDEQETGGENLKRRQRQQQQEQEAQLNAAIAALAIEEQQLEEAANAVNQIEAEFDELNSSTATTAATLASTVGNSTNQTQQLPYDMDFSVSATNNTPNLRNSSSSSGSGGGGGDFGGGCDSGADTPRSSLDSNYSNRSSLSQDTVIAVDLSKPQTSQNQTKLQRKPSNEMVHHRNLLKMFKDTFKNDIELEEVVEDELALKSVESVAATQPDSPPIKPNLASNPSTPLATPQSPSMIPRAIALSHNNKPPATAKTVARGLPMLPTDVSPPNSPLLSRKANTAFSINGRVEIFNSKTMLDGNNATATSSTATQQPPTKKPYLAHLPNQMPAAVKSKAIELPTSEQPQQQPPPSNTKNGKVAATVQALNEVKPATAAAASASVAATSSTKVNVGQQQPQKNQENQTEIVMCAPPVTIVNPDELPKPNTVKALSNCFARDACSNSSSSFTPLNRSMPPPKPLPRTRIPLSTPPQSPIAAKRNLPHVNADITERVRKAAAMPSSALNDEQQLLPTNDAEKKLSIISTASSSTISSENAIPAGPFKTKAVVHTTPAFVEQPKPLPTPPKNVALNSKPNYLPISSKASTASSPTTPKSPLSPSIEKEDPLKPNARLTPKIDSPAEMPDLMICTPNDSSLFKLATSTPSSPSSPCKPIEAPSEEDVAICSSFLSSIVPKSPKCLRKSNDGEPIRQQTIEEMPCEKVDIKKLPPQAQVPWTSYREIDADEIRRCDNFNENQSKTKNPNSKPTSPILAARAAHSKALIDTCEKIIAEERAASNHIKSSITSSPKSTPLMARKSKIPKPIQCCIGSPTTDTLTLKKHRNEAQQPKNETTPDTVDGTTADDENMLVGRLHVVETQIKVTTTTPPASPKPEKSEKPKGVKNTIFDFLKKNFGHHDAEQAAATATPTHSEGTVSIQKSIDAQNLAQVDEIHKVENSKFYLPSAEHENDASPPPLPKTPAPVNIEITRRITTDEIKAENNSDTIEFSQELSDLLDDELNKLSLEHNVAEDEGVAK